MFKWKRILYLISVNSAVLMGMLFLFNVASLVLLSSLPATKPNSLPVSPQKNWDDDAADVIQRTGNFRNYEYKSYIGWRHSKYASSVLNVNQAGIRQGAVSSGGNKLAVFGGSTVWGYGVSDRNTIPSLVSTASSGAFRGTNFGEQAYVSGQSLSLLIQLLKSGDLSDYKAIIFYDGVNDVIHGCNSAIGPDQHYQYPRINQMIQLTLSRGDSYSEGLFHAFRGFIYTLLFKHTKAGIMRLAWGAVERPRISDPTNATLLCGRDEGFADAVADNLVRNWSMAHELAQSRGLMFRAVLQPTPYLRQHDTAIRLNNDWLSQYKAVYPRILAKATQYHWFVDMHDLFSDRSGVYIDSCCHLNREGNLAVAKAMTNESVWKPSH